MCVGRWEEEENDYGGQRERGRGGGPETDHHYSPPILHTHAHTHTVVKGSPAVHVDHDNTLEEELNTHCTRGGSGKKGDVEEEGMEGGKRRE